jgi:hypothetical protein
MVGGGLGVCVSVCVREEWRGAEYGAVEHCDCRNVLLVNKFVCDCEGNGGGAGGDVSVEQGMHGIAAAGQGGSGVEPEPAHLQSMCGVR